MESEERKCKYRKQKIKIFSEEIIDLNLKIKDNFFGKISELLFFGSNMYNCTFSYFHNLDWNVSFCMKTKLTIENENKKLNPNIQ